MYPKSFLLFQIVFFFNVLMWIFMIDCQGVCVCVCVRACVRACVRVRARACVCVRTWQFYFDLSIIHQNNSTSTISSHFEEGKLPEPGYDALNFKIWRKKKIFCQFRFCNWWGQRQIWRNVWLTYFVWDWWAGNKELWLQDMFLSYKFLSNRAVNIFFWSYLSEKKKILFRLVCFCRF